MREFRHRKLTIESSLIGFMIAVTSILKSIQVIGGGEMVRGVLTGSSLSESAIPLIPPDLSLKS